MVGRYTAGAMNLPFFPLRSYFETDLPVANPLIRPIDSPYGDGTVYAVPPLKPGCDDRPRAACVGRGRHPGLGPARLPEGGCLRRRPGDRRRGGARRRGGHPRRSEPDDHPGPHRGRRRRRAVGRASVLRAGRLRPRQPLLSRLGPDLAGRGHGPGLAARVGLRRGGPGRVPRQARRGAARDRCNPAPRRPARSTTVPTGDRQPHWIRACGAPISDRGPARDRN